MMKRMFYLMVAALCVLIGCTNEEIVENSVVVKGSIKATLEQGSSSSRMAIGTNNSLTWTAGDAFVMFSSDGTVKETWTLKEGAGEDIASFTGNMIEGELQGAAYPASANPTLNGTILSMTLPAERIFSADAACDLPMWATFNSLTNNIIFTHFCALLKVGVNDIPKGYNTLIVEADKPLAGDFSTDISWKSGKVAMIAVDGNETKTVKVTFDAIDASTDNDRMFYLPLPVNNYGSLVIKISNGSDEIVLNEWKDRTIQRGKVYWTSLTYKVSEATTAAEVTAELQSLTAVSPTVQVTFANEVDATQPIVIPAVEGAVANAKLVFETVSATTSGSPMTFLGAETSADTEADMTIVSYPKDESNPIYLTVDAPVNTFTLENGCFADVVSLTAAQTLIVEKDVVIENLIIKGGNVVVYGEITGSITRHADNADAETRVANMGGKLPENIGEGINVYSSEVIADQAWYTENLNASELTISTRQELVGFMDLLYMGTSFEGKIVKMANDIDLYGYTYKTSGMVYQYGAYGFKGTFDGQGYTIRNLNIEYVYTAMDNARNISVGLIPAASLATIQNVIVEGGKIYVPSFTEIIDRNGSVHAGVIVGISNGSVIVNCHNRACDVVAEVPGYFAGIVGYLRKINDDSGVSHVSHVMACSNSGTVKTNFADGYNSSCIAGISAGGWGQGSFVVGCYNTGTVLYAADISQSYIGGIVNVFDGLNYLYGCFNDGLVTGAAYCGDLVAYASYSGYYRYSCYTGENFAGRDWTGEANRQELHKCSYAEAVDVLNAGIEAYNADPNSSAICYYRYVKGNVPSLAKSGSSGENSDVSNGAWDVE